MKLNPEFKRVMDEISSGATLQVINAVQHSAISPEAQPLAIMTIFLACFNQVARGAPSEAHGMVVEILEANLEMVKKQWGMTSTPKETSRLILPFN
jgi:hypothetical protein